MSDHPGVFKVECRPCSVPRLAIGPILVCLVCDRGVKDGVIVGPEIARMREFPPLYPARTWDVRKDKL